MSGPFDSSCLFESFRGCGSSADCPLPGDICVSRVRQCYTDLGLVGGQVKACGLPDPPDSLAISKRTVASLFCIPPTTISAVNSVGGLPGLGRLTLPGTSVQLLIP